LAFFNKNKMERKRISIEGAQGGKSPFGVPKFPGMRNGLTQEQVQEFIRNQVRRTGFRFSGGTSPQNFNLDLPGDARFLYGVAFLNSSFGVCELKINNETVIESTDTGFLQFGLTEQDYFAVNRPLSGSDKVTLNIQGDAGYTNQPFIVYYK
jgi:hypothetical protein